MKRAIMSIAPQVLRDLLELPEDIEILGVRSDGLGMQFDLLLSGDSLPVDESMPPGWMPSGLPRVQAVYQKNDVLSDPVIAHFHHFERLP